MPFLKRFEELDAWQAARELTKAIYEMTDCESFRRDYTLKDQVRRASVSIMNNVAEGFDSGSTAEFVRFLGYARRSGSEVQSCLYVARDRSYCSETSFRTAYECAERCRGLANGLIRYLRSGQRSARQYVYMSARIHGRP